MKAIKTIERNGMICYYSPHGQRHNLYGPAVMSSEGKLASYYIYGKYFTKSEWEMKRQYYIIQGNLELLIK